MDSTVNQFLGTRYILNVPPWFLLHWYVSRHRHRCPKGICNSYEWIIYGRLKGFGNMSSSSNMGSWRVPGLFIIPCLVRIYKRSSTSKSCDLGWGVRVKMDSRSASLKMSTSTDRYLSRKQSQAQGAKTQITINHMYFSRWWFQTFALFTRIPGEYFSNGWFKHQLVFVTCNINVGKSQTFKHFMCSVLHVFTCWFNIPGCYPHPQTPFLGKRPLTDRAPKGYESSSNHWFPGVNSQFHGVYTEYCICIFQTLRNGLSVCIGALGAFVTWQHVNEREVFDVIYL